MSCDVCPFCGKTYQRLKRHLPHCKAAAKTQTPPGQNDASAQQPKKCSPQVVDESLLVAAAPKSKKSKKASPLPTTPAASLQSGVLSTTSQSACQSSTASSALAKKRKKKKEKLSDLIKAAAAAASSSSSASLTSTQSPPAAPFSSKSKKKNERVLTEDTKTGPVSQRGLVGGHELSSEDLAGTGSHGGAAAPTRPGPDQGGSIHRAAEVKALAAAEVETSRTSDSFVRRDSEEGDSEGCFSGTSRRSEDSSISHLILKAGSGHQVARITIQDAKATLGRKSHIRAGLLHQLVLPGSGDEVRTGANLSPASLPAETRPFPSIPSPPAAPRLIQAKGSNPQPPTRPLLPLVSQATPPLPPAVSLNEALHTISPILSPLCRRHPLPVGPLQFPGGAEPQPHGGSRAPSSGSRGATGSLEPQRLGQVTLKELPDWLCGHAPRQPRDLLTMLQKGWQWYYRRYIDVKKGGVGGLGMLLAGYCLLSYVWIYPHMKQHRWRKHH